MTRPYQPQPVRRIVARLEHAILNEMDRALQALQDTLDSIAPAGSLGAHASSHQNGGSDEIAVTGLSGLLADAQTPLAHNLLSTSHGDTLAASAVRGDLMIGNATPKWARLAVGAASTILKSDGTDVSWVTPSSLGGAFADDIFRVVDNSDGTKKLAFELSGFTTATTRTLTPPNASGTLALLGISTQTWTGINIWDAGGGDPKLTIDPTSGVYPLLLFGGGLNVLAFDAANSEMGMSAFSIWPSGVGAGFKATVVTAVLSANRTITIPNLTGTLCLIAATQNLTNKTLTTSNFINVSASTSHTQFQDGSDTTKKLQLNLGGQTTAVTNVLATEGTAARTWTLPNVTGKVPITVFTQTADATVANTTTETTIIGSGVGTLTLPANALIAGRMVRIKMSGRYSTVAVTGGQITVKVKYGSTTLASKATSSLLTGASNLYWEGEVCFTCRTTGASGSVMTSGRAGYQIDATTHAVAWDELNNSGSTTTIDTTAASALDVTVTWSAANASNTVTSLVSSVEVLN